jgi:hypothetical protein
LAFPFQGNNVCESFKAIQHLSLKHPCATFCCVTLDLN